MEDRIEQLRQERILLLYESYESKSQFVKQKIHKRLRKINIELFKETQNTIYL